MSIISLSKPVGRYLMNGKISGEQQRMMRGSRYIANATRARKGRFCAANAVTTSASADGVLDDRVAFPIGMAAIYRTQAPDPIVAPATSIEMHRVCSCEGRFPLLAIEVVESMVAEFRRFTPVRWLS